MHRSRPAHGSDQRQPDRQALTVGVDGTPTFVINGRMLSGAQPPSEFESVIDEELAQQNVKEAKGQLGPSLGFEECRELE